MDAAPRGVDEPMFGPRVLAIACLQGLSVLAATVCVYLWAVWSQHPDDVVRSVTFATLLIGNVALIVVNRSWRLTVWRTFRERRNAALKWILAGAPALLVVILTVPALRHAFNFGPLPPLGWLVAVGAGVAGVAWFEVYKAVAARRHHREVTS
jgi:Ca2+-transporting ATPase